MSQCLQTSYLIKKKKKITLTIAEQTWSAFVHFQRPSVLAQEKGGDFFIVSHFIHQTVFTDFSQNVPLLCTLPFYIYIFFIFGRRGFIYITRVVILKFRLCFSIFFFSVLRVDKDFSFFIFVFARKTYLLFFQNI